MGDYLLKQALALIEPMGFVWALLLGFTAWFVRHRCRLPAFATGFCALLIFAFGSTDLPSALLRTLERPYTGIDIAALPKADAIVLLGGGAQPARYEVGGMHLTTAADRLIMAMELTRLEKAPVLVVGGAAATFPEGDRSESETVRRWIVERNLARGEVVALPICRHTHDEARFTAQIAAERGWRRVLLVTSANHMRRAAATFQTAGLAVIPAPCNFLTGLSKPPSLELPGVPKAGGFERTAIWLHETIGWFEYRRRGWIRERGGEGE